MRNTLPILSTLVLLGISAQGQNASFFKELPLFSTASDPNHPPFSPPSGPATSSF